MRERQEETYQERSLALCLLDLVDSTRFVQKVGPELAARWFQRHDRLTRTLLYRFGGREIDRSDGFLFSFERPINAVNFALYYQQTIPFEIRLMARIGIHYGSIIEVKQTELMIMGGAKPIELEGITKNIAARTMSVCMPGQVLITRDMFAKVVHKANRMTPKDTRFACVGIYKMKGVAEAQVLYAVGSDIKMMQPPQGSAKVVRIGGPKKIRSRARHRKIREWIEWGIKRSALISSGYILAHMWPYIKYKYGSVLSQLMEIYELYR